MKRSGLGYQTYRPFVERFLKELKERFGENILACALFGSVARGEAKPESDIDLLVLHSEMNLSKKDALTHLLVEADQWEERRSLWDKAIYGELATISRTEEELSEDPLLLLDILDHGHILYDPDRRLQTLLDRLRAKLRDLGARKVVFRDGSWAWDLKPDWKPGEVVEVKL